MTRSLALLSLLVIAGATPAQRCVFIPDNSPGSGYGNVIPFGRQSTTDPTWSNQKYQALVPATSLGNVPGRICALAFVPRTTGHREFKSLVIKFAQTSITTMTTNFAGNLGTNATTVLDARDYIWKNSVGLWERVGLQNPFVYIPARGNLLVQIEVRGAGMPDTNYAHAGCRSVTIPRLYAFGWATNPPAAGTLSTSAGLAMEFCFDTNDASEFGRGCKGSNNSIPTLTYSGSAKLGSTLSVNLAGAIATRPAVFIIGFSNANPLPIELTAAGAPGCHLYQTLDLALGLLTDSSGGATLKLPVPNDAGLVCAKFYTQYFPQDVKANQLRLVASNYGRVLLGH